jgi:hypothetical protein
MIGDHCCQDETGHRLHDPHGRVAPGAGRVKFDQPIDQHVQEIGPPSHMSAAPSPMTGEPCHAIAADSRYRATEPRPRDSALSPSRSASRSGRSLRSSGSRSRQELGLNDTQFGLLVGTPILTGSLVRLFLGVWTDQYGGRIVFPLTMLASALRDLAADFCRQLPDDAAGGAGAGHGRRRPSRSASPMSPSGIRKEKQGTALGIFGAGNVGAAVTKFVAPWSWWPMAGKPWRRSGPSLAVTAVCSSCLAKDDPDLAARKISGEGPRA